MATGLIFRYLEDYSRIQTFRVPYEDRSVMVECRGGIHEFAINSNICCDGKYKLREVADSREIPSPKVVPISLDQIQYVPFPYARRHEFNDRNFDRDGNEIGGCESEPIKKEPERSEADKEDEALIRLRAIQAREGD